MRTAHSPPRLRLGANIFIQVSIYMIQEHIPHHQLHIIMPHLINKQRGSPTLIRQFFVQIHGMLHWHHLIQPTMYQKRGCLNTGHVVHIRKLVSEKGTARFDDNPKHAHKGRVEYEPADCLVVLIGAGLGSEVAAGTAP